MLNQVYRCNLACKKKVERYDSRSLQFLLCWVEGRGQADCGRDPPGRPNAAVQALPLALRMLVAPIQAVKEQLLWLL